MEKEKLKETVLVNLRSVAQSAKGGVLINRLQDDYRKWIGTLIPYQSLGYSTLEQFLSDIPHVVQLKRKGGDNQLYVEAVTDESTAHLANLISKQKGASAKSSSASQKYGFRRTVSKKSANSAGNLDEKDKIIEDLRRSLEKERKVNKDFSSQVIRLNSLIRMGQDALTAEQEKVKKLNVHLEALKKNEERIDKSKDTDLYIKTINNLKSKLIEQESKNKVLSSRVNFLSDVNQSKISNEKELLLQINNQIGLLQKKLYYDLEVTNSLASIDSTILKRINTLNTPNASLETECKENVNATSNTSTKDGNNNTYGNILNLYAEQCEKIQNLENQLEQQNRDAKKFEVKIEKQFQKLYAKVNTQSQESAGMKYTIAQLTGLFESQILNKKENGLSDIFCQCPETENAQNSINEESSEKSSVTAESIVSIAKRKKKRKKTKEVAENSSVYVPPHRRTDMHEVQFS